MKIEFDEAAHAYKLDGVPVPSVTQILDPLTDFSHVSPDVLVRARLFGTAVHKMVELFERDDLDTDKLDPALLPYLGQYRAAKHLHKWDIAGCEIRVGHPALRYAGTLDLVVGGDKPAVIDIKSGQMPPTVGAQVAAYAEAYQHMKKSNKLRRFCLCLTAESFKLTELKDPADWSLFVSALNIYRFKEKYHVRN